MVVKVIHSIYKQLLKCYFFIKPYVSLILNLFNRFSCFDVNKIPIIINNRNRYSSLLLLIEGLEKRGYKNIYIIDNASTYPPLLKYYNKCTYKIFYLDKNLGHLSLWESGIIKQFRNNYFVYTDPDLVLEEICPCDFMSIFLDVMKRYPLVEKVGFSLKIDDLPDCFSQRESVQKWEEQFWKYKIADNPPLYKAAIDTTFALYRPHFFVGGNLRSPHIRVGSPYIMRHIPWYNNSSSLSEEEVFYRQHCETITHWTTGKLR